MRRFGMVLFSLVVLGCSGEGAIEPVLDIGGESLTGDTALEDQKGQDLSVLDVVPDGVVWKDQFDDQGPLPDLPLVDVIADVPDLAEDILPDEEGDLFVDTAPDTTEPDLLPTEPTCHDYILCAQNAGCSGVGLCPACADLLVGEVQAELSALSGCIQTNCSGLEGEAFGECIWGICGIEWLECIGGEGQGTCNDVLTCASDCDQFTDSECMQVCVSMSDEVALDMVLKIFSDQVVPDDQKFAYVADCVGGQGSGSCMDALSCMNQCGEENPPCTVGCLQDTSADAVEKLKAMMVCAGGPCFVPAIYCIGGGGTESCMTTLQCMNACGEDPEGACFTQCAAASSAEATEQIAAFSTCLEEKCDGQMQGCVAAQECLALCQN